MSKDQLPPLPTLPRGQGNMRYTKKGKIEYRKSITLNNGNHIRKSVNGDTVLDCFKKMEELEKTIRRGGTTRNNKTTLEEELNSWCVSFKQKELKQQPYIRLKSTIRNQISKYDISHYRCHSITALDIQRHLDCLNSKGYSYSVIKKTYDCLNEFFRFISARDNTDNPMNLVIKPRECNTNAEKKEIHYFEQEDIEKFIKQCQIKWKTRNEGKYSDKTSYRYRYGLVIAANIFLGLRIGELLALQWRDIDFEKHTIYVSKTLIEIDNPDYDSNNEEEMKRNGIKKVIFAIQHSTKISKNRYVPINKKAENLLKQYFESAQYTNPQDYVISTRSGKTSTPKNISDSIKAIEKEAGTTVTYAGTHILRHTCASLYFRKGVAPATIANILGNSVEVLLSTYVHFAEEQLKEAASKIEIIDL